MYPASPVSPHYISRRRNRNSVIEKEKYRPRTNAPRVHYMNLSSAFRLYLEMGIFSAVVVVFVTNPDSYFLYGIDLIRYEF